MYTRGYLRIKIGGFPAIDGIETEPPYLEICNKEWTLYLYKNLILTGVIEVLGNIVDYTHKQGPGMYKKRIKP